MLRAEAFTFAPVSVGWPGLWVQWILYVCYAQFRNLSLCSAQTLEKNGPEL